MKCITAVMLTIALIACGRVSLAPVDIDDADMCAWCKMAISEKRYAAETVDADGNVHKFDNPGCMMRFVGARKSQSRIAGYYVADYRTRAWLDARKATFAKSAAIPSPMASGLAAFRDRASAKQFSASLSAQILPFEDLWTSAR